MRSGGEMVAGARVAALKGEMLFFALMLVNV